MALGQDVEKDRDIATVLGIEPGMVVQELGWDEDADEDVREAVMDRIDADLVEDAIDAVDVVLLWWRAEDGDVADGLVDSLTDLSDKGWIWLFTPKKGHTGEVLSADLAEGVSTAGMALTSPVTVSKEWQSHKIVRPKGFRR